MENQFTIWCKCGHAVIKKVEHRSTNTMHCTHCGASFEVYTYFRELPKAICRCDDLVKLGVAEAMRECDEFCENSTPE